MTVFEELKARGLLAQCTNEEEVKRLIDNGEAIFYIGFDPTADSLHVGHLMQLIIMRHLQRAGNKAIALLGGGTAMVGDPSGRTDMRSMMTQETIQNNIAKFRVQMSKIVDFTNDRAIMVDNADWLLKLNYVEFLRDIGVHFSVNRMLTAECVKSRLERGLTFLEFNYMLMQGYDYYVLNQRYGANIQSGGDDQWSNILAGTDLIRRKTGRDVHGVTFALLLTSEGKKMGKTMGGAVWLDPEKTSPYEFYQYWRNIDDADVIRTMKMVTYVPLEEIATFEGLSGAELNPVKARLAFEVTKIVHGEEEAKKAQDAATGVFSAGAAENMPTVELPQDAFTDGKISVGDLLVRAQLAASKGEARRLVDQGGVVVGDGKVTSATAQFESSLFAGDGVIVRKGKKGFKRVILA